MTSKRRRRRNKRQPDKAVASVRVGSAVDRIVSVVAPTWGLRRARSRKLSSLLSNISSRSSYKGGAKGRLRQYWLPGGGSADSDIIAELPELRERSRDLVRNNPLAAGIMITIGANVVGTGIRPQSTVEDKKFADAAELAWRKWVPNADITGRLDFYGLQRLVLRQELENGDSFARLDRSSKSKGIRLDIIEADRIVTPVKYRLDERVRGGVQIDNDGKPVKYYVRQTHPGDATEPWRSKKHAQTSYQVMQATGTGGRPNILHMYDPTRAGQSRGVPILAPAMDFFKDLSDYLQAELVANLMAACYGIIIKKNDAYNTAQAEITANTDNTQADDKEVKFEPGMQIFLEPGEDVESFMPNRPGSSFDMFVLRILRTIGTSIGLPLEHLCMDYSRTSYSSARTSELAARRNYKIRQANLNANFNTPTWEAVLEDAALNGELPISAAEFMANRYKYTRVEWVGQGWDWVDPLKEIKAFTAAVELGVMSRTTITRGQGREWTDVIDQLAAEAKAIEEREKKAGRSIIGKNTRAQNKINTEGTESTENTEKKKKDPGEKEEKDTKEKEETEENKKGAGFPPARE